MPKFAVYPGYMKSKYDGQVYWISAQQLMDLYKVNRNECCTCAGNDDYCRRKAKKDKSMIHLFPNYDGDYSQFWLKDKDK